MRGNNGRDGGILDVEMISETDAVVVAWSACRAFWLLTYVCGGIHNTSTYSEVPVYQFKGDGLGDPPSTPA